MYPWLNGVGVALITPFHPDGTIDFDSLQRVIDHCIDGKVSYLVTLGTTGETATLTKSEKKAIIQFTIECVNHRVPVVVGIGGNDTAALLEDFKELPLKGASAVLSVSPYYNKPNQEGLFRHYSAIIEHCPLPVILYNVPARTSSNVSAETTLKLANKFPHCIAMKEASGDFLQIMDILKNKPSHFAVVSGDDAITLPLMACGVGGVISVIANALPHAFSALVDHALHNRYLEAQKIQYAILPLIQLIFKEGNPTGVKSLMHHQGLIQHPHCRLPLIEASEGLQKQIREAFIQFQTHFQRS